MESPVASPVISAVARVTPPNRYTQAELSDDLIALWSRRHTFNRARIETLHASVKVDTRHLALPKADYAMLESFEDRNKAWQGAALELAERAARDALALASLTPQEVDAIFFTTVTGLATPSIDARLVGRLGFRNDLKRLPLFGLGCVAGVAGTARASEYLRAFPSHTALLVAVELCSLTVQHDDLSVANLIAAGLFGDGGAALVMRGAQTRARGPRVLATKSIFYPDTEGVMGWEFLNTGFKVVLTADVPRMVSDHLRGDVDAFLAEHALDRSNIKHWVAHTGGPKVLEALEASLELPDNALARSWASLKTVGNLSSASVLHVLSALLESNEAQEGDVGLMVAMGPGFCSELVLLRW